MPVTYGIFIIVEKRHFQKYNIIQDTQLNFFSHEIGIYRRNTTTNNSMARHTPFIINIFYFSPKWEVFIVFEKINC